MKKNRLQFLDLAWAGCSDQIILKNPETSTEIIHRDEDGIVREVLIKLTMRFLETKVRRIQKKIKRPRIRTPE